MICDLLGHHKEVWKQKFNLIFISIQLSEMHGMLKVKIYCSKIRTNHF